MYCFFFNRSYYVLLILLGSLNPGYLAMKRKSPFLMPTMIVWSASSNLINFKCMEDTCIRIVNQDSK